ncbi:peptide chain release factor N(5)-glutamine methyltransferase [Chryseobacterium aquaticum]|jgi:release factor glutamine methyltransferase|uniref:peptide chain release factor N(5)-glutamine methyltransferase n=1 Tax=Chryseobacterium aquaticum TaxID=452084 RepID=A0A848N2C5_9FLAO|nr:MULTISPECIES: peptide chain release factor N(5)-glutamine methyltransferase [Chryseobacterium]NMR32599.1 peptide chain release factor N(5)-glutamine methyltransferase [Chryseobacterium aquaticum]NRQ45471.1 peptide chain release factor N(5)-glutamine methyltransferase [Chryseobacterium sp. C-204]
MIVADIKNIFKSEISGLYTDSEADFLFSVFVEKVLGLNQIQIRMNNDLKLSDENEKKFKNIISDLKTEKPYQYILGETEFYGMCFYVNENVLIPRPETEELLELAIDKIQSSKLDIDQLKILDIGTGSGIIPLVLKKHFSNAKISSIDFSEKALEAAKRNAEFHQLEVSFIHADYLNFNLNENYDVIISNPPYIGMDEEIEIEYSVKDFEPKMALFSPTEDALIFYKKIAEDSKKYLNKNGLLFLEINQKLGKETLELYKNEFKEADLIKDLSGNDRFVIAAK